MTEIPPTPAFMDQCSIHRQTESVDDPKQFPDGDKLRLLMVIVVTANPAPWLIRLLN
jgi:hypothetical protein